MQPFSRERTGKWITSLRPRFSSRRLRYLGACCYLTYLLRWRMVAIYIPSPVKMAIFLHDLKCLTKKNRSIFRRKLEFSTKIAPILTKCHGQMVPTTILWLDFREKSKAGGYRFKAKIASWMVSPIFVAYPGRSYWHTTSKNRSQIWLQVKKSVA